MQFHDDGEALSALFQVNQYRQDAQKRYDSAKQDLKNAKQIQAEILDRIDDHVRDNKTAAAQKALLDQGTSAEGLRQLRESLGMEEFGVRKKDVED